MLSRPSLSSNRSMSPGFFSLVDLCSLLALGGSRARVLGVYQGGFSVSSTVSVCDIGECGFMLWTPAPRGTIPLEFRIHSVLETPVVCCICVVPGAGSVL